MRKVSAAFGVLFMVAVAISVMALPAFAASYPPASTTPTTKAAVPSTAEAAANLAFTGSSHSQPLFVIGVIAVTLGAVIVVATRRRGSVQARKISS